MEDNKNIKSNFYKGCNRARNVLYGELRVLGDNGDGSFQGESIRYGTIYRKLNKSEFYFYEFH